MSKPHVRVYLDDATQPVIDHELPTALTLDTRTLPDGPHRLIIRAEDQSGAEGVEEIPFHVQNGPGILVSGLRPGSTRRGTLHLTVDAFSTDDPFDPRRAEARSSIPVWVWVSACSWWRGRCSMPRACGRCRRRTRTRRPICTRLNTRRRRRSNARREQVRSMWCAECAMTWRARCLMRA